MLSPLLFSISANDVSHSITKSSFLLYADDMKVFREIRHQRDCVDLQRDIKSLVGWRLRNYLNINLSKTTVMAYSGKSSTIIFDYIIRSKVLSRVNEIKDLGAVFDSVRFQSNVTHIVKSALSIIGLVCRTSREFRVPSTFVTSSSSLCRHQLKLCICCLERDMSLEFVMAFTCRKRNFCQYLRTVSRLPVFLFLLMISYQIYKVVEVLPRHSYFINVLIV